MASASSVLSSRAVIDQPIGIIRSRAGGSAQEAFDRLRRISQSEKVDLAVIAQRLVEEAVHGSLPCPPPRPRPRTLTQTIRAREDQPTLIGGLAGREETRAITGLPGFAELPGVGYAFGGRTNTLSDTELMILITPHRLRSPNRETGTIFTGPSERGVTPSTLPSERVQPP